MDQRKIEDLLTGIIEQVTGIKITDKNKNLFGNDYAVAPRSMMYIVKEFEKKLGKEITTIFRTNDIGIMTVNNLSCSILNQMIMVDDDGRNHHGSS